MTARLSSEHYSSRDAILLLLASPSEIGWLIGPQMENDPNELLLGAHTLLGNNIAHEPYLSWRLHA